MAAEAYTTATTTASQAVGAVAGKVGVGQGGVASEVPTTGEGVDVVKKGDERVDGMKDEAVENYLRSQVPSTSASNQGTS
jgi:hypothetical protein